MTPFRIIITIVFAVAGGLIASHWFLSNDISQFVADHLSGTDETAVYSHAGDYYNALWGLPIALVGAIVVAVVTYFAALLTIRQGDVQILEFVESKLKPAKENYAALMEQIGRLDFVGRKMFLLSEALLNDLDEVDPDAQLGITQRLDRLQQSAVAKHADHLNQAKKLCEDQEDATREVARIFRTLSLDAYAAAIHTAHMNKQDPTRRPLGYLKEKMPSAAGIQKHEVSENMFDLAENLVNVAITTNWQHFVGAYILTPDDQELESRDYLGHAIRPIFLDLKRPISRNGFKIEGYTFNLGAAYLLTIIAFLPEADMVRDVFKRIFGNRSEIAMRFLDIAGLDRAALGPFSIVGNALDRLKSPERLVLVRLEDGKGRRTQFYDRNRHGAIPRSGYVDDPDGTQAGRSEVSFVALDRSRFLERGRLKARMTYARSLKWRWRHLF